MFQVVDIAIQNVSTRQYLIDTVRIITGVSNFAVKVAPHVTEVNTNIKSKKFYFFNILLVFQEKKMQLWTHIENISNNICIGSEEPYLTNLIEHLVNSIRNTEIPKEMKTLQVSILTNLCFKNEIAIACLLRFVKSKELLKSIFETRILWCKMAIAIARFDCYLLEYELTSNLKFVFDFEYFSGLMRSKDHRLLNHILELLEVGLQRDEHSKSIMQQFDFKETIEGVLTVCLISKCFLILRK